jgi:hypothetical protein
MDKKVSVSATEEMIMNYSALPPELDGWRRFRLEYGGHAEACFKEQTIYTPPRSDGYIFDLLFDFWQATGKARRKILHKIIQEMERNL